MRSLLRRFVTLALLVAVLAAPALAAGTSAAKPAAPATVESLLSGLRWLWHTAVHLVTPAGHPAGRSRVTPACLGPGADPDGGCPPRSILPNLGPGADPDG
jgi:hypothetical protein